ncbi:EamA family transporter [Bacillus sp. P1(2020)]|uniref:EamA family transporter n=1 Tax=Pallidibacillus pasinlerensis TaxID=2703818 RepID=A0ABX0A465_9BACI|nr:EamA family transporter [Pallidibacillus pasinlerensis]
MALAFYTLYPVKLLQENHPTVIVGWAMLIAGIGMSFIEPPWAVDISKWTGETYVYLTMVIVFGTMLSFWFYLSSLKYLTPQDLNIRAHISCALFMLNSRSP